MIGRVLVMIGLVGGCGRLGFDELVEPTRDSATDGARDSAQAFGHDEDRDTIDDAFDVCPHVQDLAQADSDGDRVGDLCDPHPTQPIDRIAFFDPFVTVRSEWTSATMMTLQDDQLVIPAAGRAYRLPAGTGVAHYRVDGRFGAAGGPATQLLFGLQAPGGYYYCELYDGGGAAKLGLTYTVDGNSFFFIDSVTVQGPVANSDFTFAMVHDPADIGCTTSWDSARTVGGPRPAGLENPTDFELKLDGVDGFLNYYIDIRSDQ